MPVPIKRLTFLALISGCRFSSDLAQFLPGGLRGLSGSGLPQATVKAIEGMYLMRIGVPRVDICSTKSTIAFSSAGERYCWL